MRLLLGLFVGSVFATQALAAELTLELKTPAGRPVAGAVAMFRPAQGDAGSGFKATGPFKVAQQNIQFQPGVLIVPVGADVSFPNRDSVRHHVYSFSPAKRFELKLYGREESRSVRFDKPGVVALGCNIHDSMSGFVVVVDTPYAAKSDSAGRAVIEGVPAGAGTLTVWHPLLKSARNETVRSLKLRGDARETVVLDLRAAAPVSRNY
jgi:plastocyanin